MNARLPAATDPVEIVADWLELEALQSPQRQISLEALVRVIRRGGTTDALEDDRADQGSEASQRVAQDAFSEIEARARACGIDGAYPFEITPGLLRLRSRWQTSPYILLLLLSQVEPTTGHQGTAVLFERICSFAARQYLGGSANSSDAVRFGSPRRHPLAKLSQAIDDLCVRIGEGGGCLSPALAAHNGDDGLDIVAWRHFPDRREGKLVAFGQCACGEGWWGKLTELDGRKFVQKWFRRQLVIPPMRLFFVPRRIPQDIWQHTGIDAGIVFDRCRIVACLENLDRGFIRECTAATRLLMVR